MIYKCCKIAWKQSLTTCRLQIRIKTMNFKWTLDSEELSCYINRISVSGQWTGLVCSEFLRPHWGSIVFWGSFLFLEWDSLVQWFGFLEDKHWMVSEKKKKKHQNINLKIDGIVV